MTHLVLSGMQNLYVNSKNVAGVCNSVVSRLILSVPGRSAGDLCRGRRLGGAQFRHDVDDRKDGVGAECRRQSVEPGRRRSPARDTVGDVDDAAAGCRSAAAPAAAATTTGPY